MNHSEFALDSKHKNIIWSCLFLLGFTLSVGTSIKSYVAALAIGLPLAIALYVNNQKKAPS
ncbi:hypothetical protein [Oceanibium sediminis]|uniref:hypothetical protein n=1 Tax=Oceanibium sediminis TaxID=2026339 RepID=UPI0013001F75|nr:hypothetical protein [Oceanibium sediminis]